MVGRLLWRRYDFKRFLCMCDFVYHMNSHCNGFTSDDRMKFDLNVMDNYKEYEEKYEKEFVGGHLELQFVQGED